MRKAIVLITALWVATAVAQTATSPVPARSGAAGTRANGVPPASSRTRGATRAPQPPGSSTAGADASGPAANANGKVEVTGNDTGTHSGTADRPLLPMASPGNALGLRSGTPIFVTLKHTVDSGHAHNGDALEATLAKPLGKLPVGTPVKLTVVAATGAGRMFSYGMLSLQVVSISDSRVLSQIVTAEGKEGAKDVPDAAPARGTEAVFTPDQPITLPVA